MVSLDQGEARCDPVRKSHRRGLNGDAAAEGVPHLGAESIEALGED
jgi:hypothetical protein